jgi:hypothetical protein
VIADPLILIRYGNAMWSSRGFEIWMFKWPDLVWSFEQFSDGAKLRVIPRFPWREWRRLTMYRAIGAYSHADYRKFFRNEGRGGALQLLVSVLPASWANGLIALYWCFAKPMARDGVYDLVRSSHASVLTRLVARRLRIPLH